MPDWYISAKKFVKRDMMIFCSMGPTTGRCSFV